MVAARTRRGQVGRPAYAVERRDLALPTALVPHVVAQGDGIDPGLEDGPGQRPGDARAGGGVLAVRDHEIEPQLGAQRRHARRHDFPARPAHDVPDEKEFDHEGTRLGTNNGITISKFALPRVSLGRVFKFSHACVAGKPLLPLPEAMSFSLALRPISLRHEKILLARRPSPARHRL